jgi:hypothetical protein
MDPIRQQKAGIIETAEVALKTWIIHHRVCFIDGIIVFDWVRLQHEKFM